MAKINKRWVELDTANTDALTGADIAVSTSNTNKIDTEISKVSVSATDTTPGLLSSKIQAGSNITINTLNQGANEVIEIASTASGGGGSIEYIWLPGDMSVDSVNNNVTSGTVFSNIECLDIDSTNGDGSVWMAIVTNSNWNTANQDTIDISYVLDGAGSNGQVVKIGLDIFITNESNAQSTTPDHTATYDITLSSTIVVSEYNRLQITPPIAVGPYSLLNIKVSRLSTDVGDTYPGIFKLLNVRARQQ